MDPVLISPKDWKIATLPRWLIGYVRHWWARIFGLTETCELWLGPVEIPPSQFGEVTAILTAPLAKPYGGDLAIVGYEFTLFGAPKAARLAGAPLAEIDEHVHRLHLHHVNIVASPKNEIFAGSGHDRTPMVFPPGYYYLAESSDSWSSVLDVRNVHDDELPTDEPWIVSLRWTITVDWGSRDPAKAIRPLFIPIASGGSFSVVTNPPALPSGFTAPPLPSGAASVAALQIRRQDSAGQPSTTALRHTTTGVVMSESVAAPYDCTIQGLMVHLHNGAARVELLDGSTVVAAWEPELSEPLHPVHVVGSTLTAGSANPVRTVAAGTNLTVRATYSTNTTTRDSVKAAGGTLDGSTYDYNNGFEMADAMAIVIAAITHQ